MTYIEKIREQQIGKEGTPEFVVGEQLIDICRDDSVAQEIVNQDLDISEMSISKAAAEIKKYADSIKKNNFAFVSPQKAEEIIRKFYGIENTSVSSEPEQEPTQKQPEGFIDLASFM